MINKDAKCSLFIGARGQGKSTLAKSLIKPHKRIVVFDPMGEYARLPLYIRCETLTEVAAALKKRWRGGFKIAYIPKPPYEQNMHDLALLLMHVQKPYYNNMDDRQILLVAEEMNLSFPNRRLPPALYGQDMLTLQGRHYGINIMGITQRPAEVNKTYRGNCEDTYVFFLSEPDDIVEAARKFGAGVAERRKFETEIAALKKHFYIKKSGDGKIFRGRNKLG